MTYIDEMVKALCPNGVEWKELGEVATYSKQRVDVSGLDISNYTGVENLLQNRGGRENATSVPQTGSMIVYNCGDVLIGNIRPYLKKVWLSDRDGGTNGDVLVLKPAPGIILSRYLYYLISSDDFFHYNMQNAKGSKMPRGDKNKILAYKFQVPPLEIQEEIVKILDKFTDYVTELTAELTAELTFRQKQYTFYRDKLLTFENDVYQVEWKTLGEVAIDFGRGKSKHRPRNDSRLYGGTTPFIQTGDIRNSKGRITEYTQTYSEFGLAQSKLWKKGTLCITIAANIAEMGILDFDACFPDSVVGFLANENIALTKYIAYYLASIKDVLASKSTGSAQENLNLSSFSTLKIPLPSLAIQSRIVEVLDKFDTVCNDLNIGLPKEIELRQKQYEFFRDKLLTFAAQGVYTDSTAQHSTAQHSTAQHRQDLIRLLTWVFGPIRVELGAVATVKRGKRVVKSQLDSAKGYPVYQNSLTALGYFGDYNREAETSFIISAGAAGDIGYTRDRCWVADDVWTLETAVMDQRYLYHLLLGHQAKIKAQVRKASVPRLSKQAVEKLEIILPPLDQQNRLVAMLDKFDRLTSDLSQGLPREIALRQIQYAYWRDRLLSFPGSL